MLNRYTDAMPSKYNIIYIKIGKNSEKKNEKQ